MVLDTPLSCPLFFASDVHWPLAHDYKQGQPFLDFLDHLAGKGGTLILLGDIFDFWFEWHEVVPAYWFEIFYRLRRLREQGTVIWFISGNHDFHPGAYLEQEIGLTLCSENLVFPAAGKHFYIAHGDGLAQRDGGYRLLKRIIRHPVSIWLYKNLIHPDWGIRLARWTSATSRKHRHIDRKAWAEEYFAFARARMDAGADYVVLGHVHFPDFRKVGEKGYLNCGDWLSEFSYGLFDGKELSLQRWPVVP